MIQYPNFPQLSFKFYIICLTQVQTASLDWLMMLPFSFNGQILPPSLLPLCNFSFRKFKCLSCRSYTVWVLLIVFLGYDSTSSSGLCVSCKLVVLEVWWDSGFDFVPRIHYGWCGGLPSKTRNVSCLSAQREQPVIIIVQIHIFC